MKKITKKNKIYNIIKKEKCLCLEVIPLHLVAYSEELRTHKQAQLVVQASLAIRKRANQVFKHKVFLRRLRVNLHSLNRLLRFNSLPSCSNQLCRSKIPSSEVFPRLNLKRTQLNNSGYSVNKLINLHPLAVDFSEANKHNSRQNHSKREVVYLAEISLKTQWVEDSLAGNQEE